MSTVSLLLGLFSVISLCYFVNRWRRKRYFPPGPRGLPIVGNLFDMPVKREWLTYSRWKRTYGDIIGLEVLGQPIVVLNSANVVEALLEKRNSIYSDRPCMALLTQMCRCDWFMTALPYDREFHTQRRMINRYLNPTAIRSHYEMIHEQVLNLVQRTTRTPEDFQRHNLYMIGAITMKLVYGHEVREEGDPYLPMLKRITKCFQSLTTAGAHPVDLLPSLACLPPIVFGRSFAKELELITSLGRQILDLPYETVKKQMSQGVEQESMVTSLMSSSTTKNGEIESEKSIKAAAAITYLAGADGTVSVIDTFVLAMMLHPEAQQKAQRQIDELLQGKRLPEITDRESLCFVEAIMWEVLRWNPVAPLALPHRVMVDDEFNGMFIPAGTVVVANTWEILHDEEAYPDSMSFNPDRFILVNDKKECINRSVRDPRKYAFGYGRRACPGRHLAETTLWTAMAILLASFEISLPVDANKQPIMPDLEYESSVAASRPKPYQARFVPRSTTSFNAPISY